jgi:prevent-host-death family protein
MAMQRVKVSELKDQLSKHLRSVQAGAEVEVTDRDRPIARIVPIGNAVEPALRPPHRPFSSVRDHSHAPVNWSVSSTQLLRQDRQKR